MCFYVHKSHFKTHHDCVPADKNENANLKEKVIELDLMTGSKIS